MGRTVAELQRTMSSHEFTEWIAFYGLEPFGFRGEFMGNAMVASVIANTNRDKDTKPFKMEDFLPTDPKPPQPQTAAQMKQFASMITLALGGTINED